MSRLFLTMSALFPCIFGFCQKPVIDSTTFDKWPHFYGGQQISNNGKYVKYALENYPASGKQSLVIKGIENNWKIEIPDVTNGDFTADSRFAIYKDNKDTLDILELDGSQSQKIANVHSYIFPRDGNDGWIAYQLKDTSATLIIQNLITKAEKRFQHANNFLFNDKGSVLVFQSERQEKTRTMSVTYWYDLEKNSFKEIWKGSKVNEYTFDDAGSKLAFVSDINGANEILYFDERLEAAVPLVKQSQISTIDSNLTIDVANPKFIKNGSCLLFSLKETNSRSIDQSLPNINIWSTKDIKLQSQQLRKKSLRNYAAIITLDGHKLIRLEDDNETVLPDSYESLGEYMLISKREGDASEWFWNKFSRESFYILSTKTGEKRLLQGNILAVKSLLVLSPGGKFVIFYDKASQNYFSYETSTGIWRNISKNISVFISVDADRLNTIGAPVGIVCWLNNDSKVLIYDRNYDVWQIDPLAKHSPINLSFGFFARNRISLKLFEQKEYVNSSLQKNFELLFAAFNQQDKQNGFYKIDIDLQKSKASIHQLTMDRCLFFWPDSEGGGVPPQKAKNADKWIVMRQTSEDAPNLCFTNDFTTFTPMTELSPERKYNWLTAQFVSYPTMYHKVANGILYKPENFDPNKKYPVIFYFYEKMSQSLHSFIYPEASNGEMNIPYFVSNGYVVCCPDISYKIGDPGESAYNYVVSAAKYLATQPWLDDKKMGIQGISWGGYEVNYIASRTNIFAAAAPSAGPSDFISDYGALWNNISKQFGFEVDQSRIGATLWQRPDLYLRNSPLFKADHISTPMLIMQNSEDKSVQWSQGLELYMAMRRLGKTAWMLEYDKEGHGLIGIKNRNDYSIRLAQFFDHYLKGAPAPIWMTRGIPARLKQVITGYDLDPGGSCGKDCKICKMWNEKMKKDPVGTMKEIERRKEEEHWTGAGE